VPGDKAGTLPPRRPQNLQQEIHRRPQAVDKNVTLRTCPHRFPQDLSTSVRNAGARLSTAGDNSWGQMVDNVGTPPSHRGPRQTAAPHPGSAGTLRPLGLVVGPAHLPVRRRGGRYQRRAVAPRDRRRGPAVRRPAGLTRATGPSCSAMSWVGRIFRYDGGVAGPSGGAVAPRGRRFGRADRGPAGLPAHRAICHAAGAAVDPCWATDQQRPSSGVPIVLRSRASGPAGGVRCRSCCGSRASGPASGVRCRSCCGSRASGPASGVTCRSCCATCQRADLLRYRVVDRLGRASRAGV